MTELKEMPETCNIKLKLRVEKADPVENKFEENNKKWWRNVCSG